jgi:hypothetical protein
VGDTAHHALIRNTYQPPSGGFFIPKSLGGFRVNIIQVPSPNHYDGRNGYRVDRITLHVMAGYRAGTASIFANPAYQASSTYGVGGDGRIDQYVSEADGAWADGSYDSNCRTISIEHEGGLDFIPCTQACLDASARLCADIARRYGWGKLVHGQNVFLHREVPPYTHPACPDQCPNGLNWAYIINKANQLLGAAPGEEESIMASELFDIRVQGRNVFDWFIQLSADQQPKAQAGATSALYGAKGNDGRNLFDSVIQARYDIAALKTMVTGMSAALEALSKAQGANPTDISDIVDKAVRDKLAEIHVTVTEGAGK